MNRSLLDFHSDPVRVLTLAARLSLMPGTSGKVRDSLALGLDPQQDR